MAPLQQFTRDDIDRVGGKAASLGTLLQEDIPVPPGFAVVADTYRMFLQEAKIDVEIAAQWHNLNPDDVASLDEAANTIQSLFRATPMISEVEEALFNAYRNLDVLSVAVRSSATAEDARIHSWAGELETYLNVTEASLPERVRDCWASLFTPRAIAYRYHQELHGEEIAVAVVLQQMVAAEVSGVCFTQHPVTGDFNEMVIEAVWGLGVSAVSGQVTPDSYIYDKKENMLLTSEQRMQETMVLPSGGGEGTEVVTVPAQDRDRQKLTGKHIRDLVALSQQIENIFGVPQDIEWALLDGTFYILQSRPITERGNHDKQNNR